MKKNVKYYNIYYVVAGIIALCSLILFVVIPDKFYDVTSIKHIEQLFNDFEIHAYYSRVLKNVYYESMHACFPPLIYLFYHVVAMVLPVEAIADKNILYFINYGVIYTVLILLGFYFISRRFLTKLNDKKALLFLLLMVLSSSFTFGVIQSGNIAFLPMLLLLMAVEYKDSENKVKREIALIFIALAAAIKIYPAVFGIIYLVEKRAKEAIRLIIYGILFFVVPFAFTGGIEGMLQFISNLTSVQATWGQYSPNGIYNNVMVIFDNTTLAYALTIIFGAVAFLVTPVFQDNWKRYFCVSFIMVMCPLWSGAYTPVFFLIPFLCLINDKETTNSVFDWIYAICLSIIFSCSCISLTASGMKVFFCSIIILVAMIIDETLKLKSNKQLKSKE